MMHFGQVFTEGELQYIADLCKQYNAYAVLDEVYEHLVFDGHRHVTLRSLPGMSERCLRIGSAGKTFSFTGWKVGNPRCRSALCWKNILLYWLKVGNPWCALVLCRENILLYWLEGRKPFMRVACAG
jgi:Aminotransferase class I and II